jgi:hypothetical protein
VPISDIYTWRFQPTVASTSVTAVGSLIAPTTKRSWVIGIRVKILTTGASAGYNTLVQLARPANTPQANSLAAVTPGNDYSAPSSLTQVATAWTTAPTVSTANGGVVAGYSLPQATGAMWEEYPVQGSEWGIPALGNTAANTGLHVFVTQGVSTSTPYEIDVIFSE